LKFFGKTPISGNQTVYLRSSKGLQICCALLFQWYSKPTKMKSIQLLALFFLIACGTEPSSDGISLNNGKKWTVNAEMKPHIEEANAILTQYMAGDETDYQALAQRLADQNTKLIKSCTMKGESHDELHKWLHPHMELIEQLAGADDLAAANPIIAQLESSFSTYHTYFE
jgi:hypothetical protein